MTPADLTIVSCWLSVTPERDAEMELVRNLHTRLGFRQLFVRGPNRTIGDLVAAAHAQGGQPGDLVVLADADVLLDESALLADQLRPHQVWALSRYEPVRCEQWSPLPTADQVQHGTHHDPELWKPPEPGYATWCQGSWWFRRPLYRVRGLDEMLLGRNFVDNRFAHELRAAGYEVTNPCYSVRTRHCHFSRYHAPWFAEERIPGPYATVELAKLEM